MQYHSSVDTEQKVPQADAEEIGVIVKTNIDIPAGLWKEVKKAAIDNGVTAKQFVVNVLAAHLGLKNAA